MQLNTLKPAIGSKKNAVRVGRGIGSGKGKTCGRGHKGQHARTNVKQGSEGGQMPIHRRLPKSGFVSWQKKVTTEIRLSQLNSIDSEIITIDILKEKKVISDTIRFVKIIATGEISTVKVIKGIKASKGAKQAIEVAGGRIEE